MVDPSSWEIRSTIWPQRLISARNSLDRASRIIIALGLLALFGSAAWVTYDLSPTGMNVQALTADYHTWLHPAYLNSVLISLIIFYALRQISRTREKLAPLAYPLIERVERIHGLEIWRSVEPVTRRSMHLHVIKRSRYAASREEWKTISQAWIRRAERARRLVSPHTARIIDCGFAQGNRFYSMVEMPRGIRLDEFIAVYGAVPVNRALFLLVQLAHAIQEAHHHGFEIVIGLVGGDNAGIPFTLAQRLQPLVAQPAGTHLHTFTCLQAGKGIERGGMKRQVVKISESGSKGRIAGRFFGPETKIDMPERGTIPEAEQQIGQHDRIQPPAESKQLPFRRKYVRIANMSFKFFQQHPSLLCRKDS